jgi:hypothetical protein
MHACIHTYIHTYTYIYTYIHTYRYCPQDRVSNIKEHSTARLEFADTMAAVVDILRYGSALSRYSALLQLYYSFTTALLVSANAMAAVVDILRYGSALSRYSALLALLVQKVQILTPEALRKTKRARGAGAAEPALLQLY